VDSKPTPFLFEGEITVRVIERDGELWFIAADVCRALGLTNPSETVRGLDDDEKGISSTETLGGYQEAVVISESGMFALIFKSRKPHAVRFRKWVTAEVLPSIRKRGSYGAAPPPPPVFPPSLALRMVNTARLTHGVRVAQQLWIVTGLPTVPAMRLRPEQGEMFVPMALAGPESGATSH
jgi:hypothetical protein